jgi:hypothetical protein
MPDSTRDKTSTELTAAEAARYEQARQYAQQRDQDMSPRTMLVLGGIMTVGVAGVLGMTTLAGGGAGDSGGETPARPAAATQENGTAVETVAAQQPATRAAAPVRKVAITPHVAVPPTQGLDRRTAQVRLRATRLVVANTLQVPSALPAGQVVRTFPAAGTGLPVGGRVTLYVSNGAPVLDQVTVPYLRGLTLQQAQTAAQRLGLRVAVTQGGGTVATQTPTPGSVTPRGSEIAVTLHA